MVEEPVKKGIDGQEEEPVSEEELALENWSLKKKITRNQGGLNGLF